MIIKQRATKDIAVIPLQDCLAKTVQHGTVVCKGCNVYNHLAITLKVIRLLRSIWEGFPRCKLLPPAVDVLCAFHDIGKVSPGFQQKIYHALGRQLNFNGYSDDHSSISRAALLNLNENLADLAGMHHGQTSPNKRYWDTDEVYGGTSWSAMRHALVDSLMHDYHLQDNFDIPEQLLPIALGATILSDWISSSIEVPFGVVPKDDEIYFNIKKAGFERLDIKPGLTFGDIFKNADGNGYVPNELQKICSEQIRPGGIYVIESEMGSGKTEAALFLAYKLLECKQANGIYFALPTQLTSEKIYERLDVFLKNILPEGVNRKAMLIHGDAWMKWELSSTTEQDMEDNNAHCDSWFQTKKRALLATFGAGTIDQALLSVINAKHKALRAFALSGKVVIIDEVHSYDNYTGSLVEALVKSLHDWGCTVIILSATLTDEARRRFALLQQETGAQSLEAYPLVTLNDGNGTVQSFHFDGKDTKEVLLSLTSNEEEALSEAYERAVQGEQVLWIENTVEKAQSIYKKLNQAQDDRIELGLVHSRFPKIIRAENEGKWTRIYGKHGQEERSKMGRILIGTQILEQSIDIDADFLVTRIAPADMLFQRTGRLWRHRSLQRPTTALCRALVLYDDFLCQPQQLKMKAKELLPYDAYVIYRTFEVFRKRERITLPKDIRGILEEVYAPREDEDGNIAVLQREMKEKREEMSRRANMSLGLGQQMENDDNASTRLNDQVQVKLLLLCKNAHNPQKTYRIITPFSADPIILPDDKTSYRDRISAAIKLNQCLLSINENMAPEYTSFETAFLSPLIWVGNDDFRPVRAAYVDYDGQLLDQSASPLKYKYIDEIGYFKYKE